MPGETWIPPANWTGPDAAIYLSFDSSAGLMFMEGSVEMASAPIIVGKLWHQSMGQIEAIFLQNNIKEINLIFGFFAIRKSGAFLSDYLT